MKSAPPGRFVYLCFEGIPRTVFDSQVMGFIRAMSARGLVFDLHIFESLGAAIRNREWNGRRLDELRGSWGGRLFYTPAGTKLSFPVAAGAFLSRIAPELRAGRRVVIHARGYYAALLASLTKGLSSRVFSVYDVRGDAEAELHYRMESERGPLASLRRLDLAMLRRIEGAAVRGADHLLCVSEKLRTVLTSRWGITAGIDVVPTCADPRMFHFDELARARLRQEFGFAGRIVVAYSGSMYRWQQAETTFELVSALRAARPEVHLLFVTPDVDEARAALGHRLPPGSVTIVRAKYDEMPAYLSAADLGLLLRERHPLNEVACPTKFGEYLMCGLPVVVTEGVGDLADFVGRERVGMVIPDASDPALILNRLDEFGSDGPAREQRFRIAEIGRRRFSWEAHVPRLEELYLGAMASAASARQLVVPTANDLTSPYRRQSMR